MKVFVINLARSIDRKEQMIEKLAKAGVEFEFFDAVDAAVEGFALSERAAPEVTLKRKGYTLLPSEIACYASHFKVWKKCVELNEPIVILEDNIDLVEGFGTLLKRVFAVAEQYGYIKLSATKPRAFKPRCSVDDKHEIGVYKKGTCGTTGYIITPDVAARFIDSSERFVEPVDDFMEKPWLHKVQAYSLKPSICFRADVASTIGSSRKNKQKSTLPAKVLIEIFRSYESVMMSIYWKY